jgi:hypothetical protein
MLISLHDSAPVLIVLRRRSGRFLFACGHSPSDNGQIGCGVTGIQQATEKQKNQPSCCPAESSSPFSAAQRLVLAYYMAVKRKSLHTPLHGGLRL